MKKSSMAIFALLASSGASFGQTAANLTNPVSQPVASGTHQFMQRGRPANFTMCTFEMCRRDASGRLRVQPVAAGSPAAVVAQASIPNEENYIVFYPAGKEGVPAARRVLRNRYLIKLKEGANLAEIQQRCNIQNIEMLAPGSRYALCEEPSAGKVLSQVSAVLADPEIESAEPLLAQKRQVRAVPTDPFYSAAGGINGNYQWYLNNTGANGGLVDIDINLEPALDFARGAGVNVAIVDDGVAIDHVELAPNANGPHLNLLDGVGNDPTTFDIFSNHGTSVAGLVAAVGNTVGMIGAAPNATLSGVRLLGDFFDDADEALALGFSPAIIDISNNSWGPIDTTLDFEAPGDATAEALRLAVIGNPTAVPPVPAARGGLGIVYVWAGGNGGEIHDNSNYDGYANSIYTIAVGAISDVGIRSSYSERGANLVVSAPSSGGAQDILTTEFGVELDEDDLPFRTSLYTTEFGGTSAAAPLVSGVVALMLQVNPNLSWRDVQDILIRTAVKVDATNGGWVDNAAGLHFNHDFGAGMIDAGAAVAAAAARTGATPTVPLLAAAATPQEKYQFFRRNSTDPAIPTGVIPEGSGSSYQVAFDFSDEANLKLEHVQLNLTVLTESRSDLEVVLISPSGTQSFLQESDADHDEQGISDWTFSTVRNWGENSAGIWLLRVVDRVTGNAAFINDAKVILHGVEDPTGVVIPAPILVSSQQVSVNQNQQFSYLIETVSAESVSVGDLPAGVTYNATTGVISGSAANAGIYQIPILMTAEGGNTSTSTVTLVVRPVAVALGSALGLPNYPVVTEGDVPWGFEFTDTNDVNVPIDQRVGARSGAGLKNNQKSIFGFNGLPKGILMFDWRTSSEEGADRLWFNFTGNVPQKWEAQLSGERGWGTLAVTMPKISNNVRWIYSKNGPTVDANGVLTGVDTAGEDRGLVDNVRIVEIEKYREDVIAAANIQGFVPVFDSRTLWMPIEFAGQSSPPTGSEVGTVGTALRNSTIGNGQTVSMSGWLDGPGTLTFTARNFAEATDVFEVLVGGVVLIEKAGQATGAVTALEGEIDIPAGRQWLQMRFRKDFRGSNARVVRDQVFDGVLLDDVKFIPTSSFNAYASNSGSVVLLPNEDNDGDGYTNHEEYAFGGNALVSDIPKNIPKLIEHDGAKYIEYGIDTTNADLNYIAQQSNNMNTWVEAQLTKLDRVEGEIEYYRIPVINSPGRDHLFYRVLANPK
ncbi:S8 family serine peptidase [Verrucomicrobiaceae bacterium 227]